jgi:hypothetical protein
MIYNTLRFLDLFGMLFFMKHYIPFTHGIAIFLLCFCNKAFANTHFDALPEYSVTAIRDMPVYQRNLSTQSNLACKAMLNELVMVKVKYWGFDNQAHWGSLIVHKSLGNDVVGIFKELFAIRFPIQAMPPIPKHLRKMPYIYENTTGSFNCRAVTDQPGILSQHSYGRAIDINPLMNPYIKDSLIIPSIAKQNVDRIRPEKGKIIPNSAVTAIFAKYGWDWGGNWYDAKDYQHFEKRANNEKRNPFGYVTPHFRYQSIINSSR